MAEERGAYLSDNRDGSENIRVLCRVRPLSPGERASGLYPTTEIDEENCRVDVYHPSQPHNEPRAFTWDASFGPSSTQRDVYNELQHVVDDVLSGFNSTLLAYGQTGSGKTYSILGPCSACAMPYSDEELLQKLDTLSPEVRNASPDQVDDGDFEVMEHTGLVPRIIRDLFDGIDIIHETGKAAAVTGQYVEIYNERVGDLLAGDVAKQNLPIRETMAGIYVEGAKTVPLESAQQAMDLVAQGTASRATAATACNARSSRSHSVLILTVAVASEEDDHAERSTIAKLVIVDLAGAERVAKSEAAGQTLVEAKSINKSLHELSNVIHGLSMMHSKRATRHIPFRNSKLTRLLEDSLGGNSRTSMLICVSPWVKDIDETLSTLNFGRRAKLIENSVKINAQTQLLTEEQSRVLLEEVAALRRANRELTERLQDAEQVVDGEINIEAVPRRLRPGFLNLLNESAVLRSRVEVAEANSTRDRERIRELEERLASAEAEAERAASDLALASDTIQRLQSETRVVVKETVLAPSMADHGMFDKPLPPPPEPHILPGMDEGAAARREEAARSFTEFVLTQFDPVYELEVFLDPLPSEPRGQSVSSKGPPTFGVLANLATCGTGVTAQSRGAVPARRGYAGIDRDGKRRGFHDLDVLPHRVEEDAVKA